MRHIDNDGAIAFRHFRPPFGTVKSAFCSSKKNISTIVFLIIFLFGQRYVLEFSCSILTTNVTISRSLNFQLIYAGRETWFSLLGNSQSIHIRVLARPTKRRCLLWLPTLEQAVVAPTAQKVGFPQNLKCR
ncbi:unnamed protein product [Ixodes persulcatus]